MTSGDLPAAAESRRCHTPLADNHHIFKRQLNKTGLTLNFDFTDPVRFCDGTQNVLQMAQRVQSFRVKISATVCGQRSLTFGEGAESWMPACSLQGLY